MGVQASGGTNFILHRGEEKDLEKHEQSCNEDRAAERNWAWERDFNSETWGCKAKRTGREAAVPRCPGFVTNRAKRAAHHWLGAGKCRRPAERHILGLEKVDQEAHSPSRTVGLRRAFSSSSRSFPASPLAKQRPHTEAMRLRMKGNDANNAAGKLNK